MKKPKANQPTPSVLEVPGARLAEEARRWFAAWKPKKTISLSAWSEQNARLVDGRRYRAFPFQRGIADAFTDPAVTQITVKKSSRIGYSQIVQNYVGYCIHQRPTRLLIYQPTIDDAEKYSKDDLEPVLQWPSTRSVVTFKPRHPDNQVRAKRFPGGWVQIKGANSPKEFRRVTADKVLLEEPDGYPPSAGQEGDQAALAFKRCVTSNEPLKAAGSTPTVAGTSRIDALFLAGTQEHRYVPCPHCGVSQRLVFGDGTGPGIRWAPKENPTRAWYRCESGCDIEESHKASMDEAGEWRAHAPENGPGHRSFHIWAAYSQFPGAAWLAIAKEFLEVRKDPNKLKTFVNQTLGETWQVRGEAPEWRRLYDRRESYPVGIVPKEALLLTGGLDVQKGHLELFVWAWGKDRQSWLIDHVVLQGNPFTREVWDSASEAIRQTYRHASGVEVRLSKVGADTGFATTQVEAWARRHTGLVIPVKGANNISAPVFAWSGVRDTTAGGKKPKRGLKLGMVGGHLITLELYGLLALDPPTKEDVKLGVVHPAGYVHLNDLASEEFCKQLVGDQWLEEKAEWKKVHATEALDGWKYARAVFTAMGLDRKPASWWRGLEAAYASEPEAAAAEPEDTEDDASPEIPPARASIETPVPPVRPKYAPRYPGGGSWFGR
jgi:phage terminase large subunit GpA-like protein